MRFTINFILIANPGLDGFSVVGLCRDSCLDMVLLEPDDLDVANLLRQCGHTKAILILGGIRPSLRNCIQAVRVVPRVDI